MKTFEYLDSLVDLMILTADVSNVVSHWMEGKYPQEQKNYTEFIARYNLIENSPAEDYIFWELRRRLGYSDEHLIKKAISKLKEEGYI